MGLPISRSAVAGAGTGRTPCSVRTVPLPTLIGAAVDRFHAEVIQAEARAHDVADGIHRADLVKVNLLDRGRVHLAIPTGPGGGNTASEFAFTRSGKRRVADHLLDVMQVPMRFRIGAVDIELAGGDALAASCVSNRNVAPVPSDDSASLRRVEVRSGVEQSADGHVAADSGECVDVAESHSSSCGSTFPAVPRIE